MAATLTAEQARTTAKHNLGEVAAGRDPAESRGQTKSNPTLDIVLEDFLDKHVDAKLKPGSAREYRRIASLYVPQSLRSRQISDVQRADIAKLHHAMRDKPYQANRM
ncbi:MAG: integrase, partial [Hyphomicrobiaceae bacterium]